MKNSVLTFLPLVLAALPHLLFATDKDVLSLKVDDLRSSLIPGLERPLNQDEPDHRGGPLELQGTCPADVTAIRVDAVVPQKSGGAAVHDSYTLKGFHRGMTSFRYRIARSLGNLGEGTTQFTVTAVRDKTPLSRTFSVLSHRRETDWRDGGPQLLPTGTNQAFSFAKMNPDGTLVTGAAFGGINEGASFRMLDNAYRRLDGSLLQSPEGGPPWVRTYPFSAGVAWVMTGDREGGDWAAIDTTGQILFHSPYPRCMDFVAGFALVQDADGKWGVIDATGKTVIEPQYNQSLGPPTLRPKTLIASLVRNQLPLVILLPSGQQWKPAENFLGSAYQDIQGHLFRIAEVQTLSSKEMVTSDTTFLFTDEGGNITGTPKLPGAVDQEDWYPDPGILAVRMNVKNDADSHRVVINPKAETPYSLPPQFGIQGTKDHRWLMNYGGFRFSYDSKVQNLTVPFSASTEWLDPVTSETWDPQSRIFRVTDQQARQSWDIPPGFKAVGRSDDSLFLSSDAANFPSSQPKGFYAGLNDYGARLRSEPSLTGKVLGTLKNILPGVDDEFPLEIDDLSPDLQTIDGFQGFWAHVREGSLKRAPHGGWVFSRFINPANEAAW